MPNRKIKVEIKNKNQENCNKNCQMEKMEIINKKFKNSFRINWNWKKGALFSLKSKVD